MTGKVHIKKICIHPDEIEIDAAVSTTISDRTVTSDKKYFMIFSKRLAWSPYHVVNKIAAHMAEHKGSNRKVFGKMLRDQMLKISEDEFQKRVYYLWSSCNYDYRIGSDGIFSLYRVARGKRVKETDPRFRVTFCKAFFQKEGGKRSDKSWYWIGKYRSTSITFDPDYGYEKSIKNDLYFYENYLYQGLSLAKLGDKTRNEEYLLKAITYFKMAMDKNRYDPLIYLNWGAALLALSRIKQEKRFLIESINRSSLAIKFDKHLHLAYQNRGLALTYLAGVNGNFKLFEYAIKNFKISVDLNSDEALTYFHWAMTLQNMAKLKDDISLYKECCKKYRAGLKLNDKDPKVHMNLGNALSVIGEKTGDEKKYKKAIQSYKTAAKYDSSSPFLLLNWGVCLQNYFTLFNKPEILEQSVKILFEGFLHAILQEEWDFAIHIAMISLFDVSEKYPDSRYSFLTYIFIEAINKINSKKSISKQSIRNLIKHKEVEKEADVIIDAIVNKRIPEKAKIDNSETLSMKTALFLAEEIINMPV
jgi:tetratricopeptide (TPR) repeat protein